MYKQQGQGWKKLRRISVFCIEINLIEQKMQLKLQLAVTVFAETAGKVSEIVEIMRYCN